MYKDMYCDVLCTFNFVNHIHISLGTSESSRTGIEVELTDQPCRTNFVICSSERTERKLCVIIVAHQVCRYCLTDDHAYVVIYCANRLSQ